MSSPSELYGGGFDFTCGVWRRFGRFGFGTLSQPRFYQLGYSPVQRLIVPANADVPVDIGTGIQFLVELDQLALRDPTLNLFDGAWLGGPGCLPVVITPAPGVTVNFDEGAGLTFNTPWNSVSLVKTDTDVWKVTGDVGP